VGALPSLSSGYLGPAVFCTCSAAEDSEGLELCWLSDPESSMGHLLIAKLIARRLPHEKRVARSLFRGNGGYPVLFRRVLLDGIVPVCFGF
jgi:hypothetical protein